MILSKLKKARIRLVRAAIHRKNFIFRKSILKIAGLRQVKAATINTFSSKRMAIAQEAAFVVKSPRWFGQPAKSHSGTFHAIEAHVLHDVIASSSSSGVIQNDRLLLPPEVIDGWPRVRTYGVTMFHMPLSGPVVRRRADMDIPNAVLIGGAGAYNWFHFIIECLPKAYLAQRLPSDYDDYPFILPEECKNLPSFSDAINVFSQGRKHIYVPKRSCARVRNLVVFDEVSFGPFGMMPGEWPKVDDYCQHDTEMKSFIKAFRGAILEGYAPSVDRKRVFLARQGIRRDFNQDELIQIAGNYGFEPVYLETMSLREQAEVFASASVVIGASGAAWVGMIFAERPIAALSWLPSTYREFSSYSTLAHLLGHEMTFIEAEYSDLLNKTGDFYKAEYTVSATAFEDAVCKVIAEL